MELSFILNSIRRRWWIVAAAVLIGLVVASQIDTSSTREYSSEALVLVESPDPGGSSAANLDRIITAELAVLRSPALADQVAEATGANQPSAVPAPVQFSQVTGTNLIRITAESTDRDRAQAVTEAYAQTYLDQRAETTRAPLDEDLRKLDEQMAGLKFFIAGADRQLADVLAPYLARQGQPNAPAIPDPRRLLPEVATNRDLLIGQYNGLVTRRQQLVEEQRTLQPSTLAQPATDAKRVPQDSDLPLQAATVGVAGLLGLSLALLSTRFSRKVTSVAEVESIVGRRVVATLPRVSPWRSSPARALQDGGRTRRREEDRLWTQVDRATPPAGPHVVVVAGTDARSGTTATALALGRRFAQQHRHTVVADCDQDSPWLSEAYAFDGGEPEGGLVPTNVARLSLLTRTTTRSLTPESLQKTIDSLLRNAEVIVIDIGHALPSRFADQATGLAHSVVLVVPSAHTTKTRLQEVAWSLKPHADRLLPVVTRPSRWPTRSAKKQGSPAGPEHQTIPDDLVLDTPLTASPFNGTSTNGDRHIDEPVDTDTGADEHADTKSEKAEKAEDRTDA